MHYVVLLATIAITSVQLSAQTFVDSAILVIDTANNASA